MSSGFRGFEQDPFFRGDAGFPSMPHMVFGRDPFENMFVPRRSNGLPHVYLPGPQRVPHPHSQLALRDPFSSMWPFGGVSPFVQMDSMFQDMQRTMRESEHNPNVHSYSSSTVMHYSSHGGDGGQPRMYHATSSTRKAPGGIKETRKSVRDSESGVQKMAIGHHIGDRSHTIEKQQNVRTQERKEHQELVNLDETDAGHFDREWQEKTRAHASRHHTSALGSGHRSHHHHHSERRGLPAATTSTAAATGEDLHVRGRRRHRPPSLSAEEGTDHESLRQREEGQHGHSKGRGVRFDVDDHSSSSYHGKTKHRKTEL